MFHRLFRTPDDYTLTLLRAGLGVVFFAHGAQKMFGWFGGYGFTGTLSRFINAMGIPEVFAVLAILAEFFGAIGLIFGLFSRISAFAITVNMLVALFLVHIHEGFFMNWLGAKTGEGFEFHILALCMLFTIIVRGAGAWSFDRLIDRTVPDAVPIYYHPHHPQPTA
jgi:putative oxidoreductase